MIPVLKPGKSGLEPLHYRPISLTSCLCNLMERLVTTRLTWFLEVHDFFSDAQCGFRKNRTSVDHILTLDSVVRVAFKQKRHVGAIFFDIEAAYDTTWRHGILTKLHKCGIRGSMGIFIQNFLAGRHFRVRVGNQLSRRCMQENGVPQGSVLSVALFAIMINDISDVLPPQLGRSLFVDDFAIWCSAARLSTMSRSLQLAVKKLERWGVMNGFRFSTQKTNAIHFCRRRNCAELCFKLYGRQIPKPPAVKFLGITFD